MRSLNVFFVLVLLAVVVMYAAEGSLAWFGASDERVGSVDAGFVRTEVVTGSVAQVCNKGNTPAFIRIALVPNWWLGESISGKPVRDSDYILTVDASDWFEADGYWYYRFALPAGGTTTELVSEFAMLGDPESMNFEMEVLCSGVQAEPDRVVSSVWPDVTVDGGVLIPAGGGS